MKYGVNHKENPKEYMKRQGRSQRKNNPIKYLLNQVRYRAKQRGLPFNLVYEELEVPTHCPILGIPLFFTEGKRTDNSYSIDKVDNSKGYTKDNSRIISLGANIRKGDFSIEQVEKLLAYMKGEL